MEISYKTLGIAILVSLVLGGIITREYAPKEVTKIQTVDHDVIHNNIITVVKEKENKDGTKETETTITDNTETTKTKKSTSTEVSQTVQKQWFVSVGAGLDGSQGISNLANPIYQLSVSRRILGPVYLGAFATTKTQVGVSVGMEF